MNIIPRPSEAIAKQMSTTFSQHWPLIYAHRLRITFQAAFF